MLTCLIIFLKTVHVFGTIEKMNYRIRTKFQGFCGQLASTGLPRNFHPQNFIGKILAVTCVAD